MRSIDHFVHLSSIRTYLADFYSHTGRPFVDPELLIRMLLVGYCFGIRSEGRLCEEVHLNLAYRWFCRLNLSGRAPDYSTFSKNRHGRFRENELLRHLFETTVARCIEEGLVSGQRMAIHASPIEADANNQNSTPKEDWDATSCTRHRQDPPIRHPYKAKEEGRVLFAHLKRILGLGRLGLQDPYSASDELLLAATAQNLRKLAKIFPAPQHRRKA